VINNSYLLSLFSGTSGYAGMSSPTLPSARKVAQPTPPWDSSVQSKARNDDLLRAALGGRRLIDEGAAQLDVKGASADYRKLFALYQGLDALTALANRASDKSMTAANQALAAKRFASGMAEVSAWIEKAQLESLRLTQGVTSSLAKTTAAVARDTSKTLTGPIHTGDPTSVAAVFQGDVRFSMTVAKVADGRTIGTPQTINIDLSDMGSTPRSLTAVISHINEKLADAGVESRVGREVIKSEPRTIQVGAKTVELPAGADQWALMLRGSSIEQISFSAPETRDAVYVVQGAGAGGDGRQLLKFDVEGGVGGPGIGDTHWVEGGIGQTALPPGVSAVRASATAPDGSLWIVADLTAGPNSQPIKGQSDVALMKYDSAGRLMFTRTLGAADEASGYAISVAADGRVAVAGSVTGALAIAGTTPGVLAGRLAGDDAGKSDSFVSVYDAAGLELWTQRRGAREADEATAVTFGEDGQIYVAGRAKSAMPGAGGIGGWDGYVQAFSQSQAYPSAPVIGKAGFSLQFGTSGDDSVAAVAVDGSNLYTAGVENGRAVVRQYALGVGGAAPTLMSTRDLGVLGGSIAGLSVADGKVVLAGTTNNAALDAGPATRAHAGGTEAFVVALASDLQAGAGDRLTYYGGAGDDTVADVKIHDGQVWITGVSNRPAGAKDGDPTEAYLAKIDPLTGGVGWSRTWKGDGEQAAPMTLAVAKDGASILDRLGLPQGVISQSDSKLLTAATSVRVGDRFYVSSPSGGRPVAITIEARDTLQSLARKIEQASRMSLKVTVASEGGEVTGKDGETTLTMGGLQRLSISARSGREGAVLTAGEAGRDALAGLGLSPGFIGMTGKDDGPKTFGLNLPSGLTAYTPDAAKRAAEQIMAAMSVVRDAYRALAPKSATKAPVGQAPAYLSARISNYQAALDRLMG
jgi:hypothetical protein